MEQQLDLPKTQPKPLARLLTPSGYHELNVVAVEGENLQKLMDRSIPEELKGYIVAFNHGGKIVEPENFYIRKDDQILLAVVPCLKKSLKC